MLLRKTAWFWKSGLAVISFVLMLSVSGCSDAPPEEDTVSETVIDIQAIPEEPQENAEEIINICIDLYKKAAEENKIDRFGNDSQHCKSVWRKWISGC